MQLIMIALGGLPGLLPVCQHAHRDQLTESASKQTLFIGQRHYDNLVKVKQSTTETTILVISDTEAQTQTGRYLQADTVTSLNHISKEEIQLPILYFFVDLCSILSFSKFTFSQEVGNRDGNSWENFIPRGIEESRNGKLTFLGDQGI